MTDIIKKNMVLINRAIGDGKDEISAKKFKAELSEINPDAELNIFFCRMNPKSSTAILNSAPAALIPQPESSLPIPRLK